MQKHEFEKLIGHCVSDECYEKIETVYMESERNFDKEGIARFYKEKDMNGIEQEYRLILKNREIENLKAQLTREKEKAFRLKNRLLKINAIASDSEGYPFLSEIEIILLGQK